jgi:hypothetical protein
VGRVATRNLALPIRTTSLSHDAVHPGFRQAELSGNDAHAVTLPMHLSNFVTIHNDPGPAKCFAFLLRSFAAGGKPFWVRPGCGISIFLRAFADSCAP